MKYIYNYSFLRSKYIYAAAAKSLQSCPTLCDPRDGSPSGSPVPGILQARTLEWVAIAFLERLTITHVFISLCISFTTNYMFMLYVHFSIGFSIICIDLFHDIYILKLLILY